MYYILNRKKKNKKIFIYSCNESTVFHQIYVLSDNHVVSNIMKCKISYNKTNTYKIMTENESYTLL